MDGQRANEENIQTETQNQNTFTNPKNKRCVPCRPPNLPPGTLASQVLVGLNDYPLNNPYV